MSETPRQEWKAQLATRAGAYHRIERAGAHPTEEPVALVKDAKDVVAIAALQDVASALRPFAEQGALDDAACHAGITTKEKCARCAPILAARRALDKMEGRIR